MKTLEPSAPAGESGQEGGEVAARAYQNSSASIGSTQSAPSRAASRASAVVISAWRYGPSSRVQRTQAVVGQFLKDHAVGAVGRAIVDDKEAVHPLGEVVEKR